MGSHSICTCKYLSVPIDDEAKSFCIFILLLFFYHNFNSKKAHPEPKTDETLTNVTSVPPTNGNNNDNESTKQELYETRKANGLK